MTNHHHKNKIEKIYGKEQSYLQTASLKKNFAVSEPMKGALLQAKVGANDNAVQVRAYQIYREKGGYALDNWLEAERNLMKS